MCVWGGGGGGGGREKEMKIGLCRHEDEVV